MIRLVPFALLLAVPVEAQISGMVRTADGRATAAEVELWSPSQRIARRVADGRGHFSFNAEETAPATAIVFAQLGYKTVLRPMAGPDSAVRITLEPASIELPEVAADGPRLCPNRADPDAEAAWRRFRQQYRPDPASEFIGTAYAVTSGVVASERVGKFDEGDNQFAVRGRRRSTPSELDIAREDYARPAGTRLVSAEQDSWEYASLGSVEADHFLTDHFAASHAFSLGTVRSDGSFDLVFCPKQNKRPDIQGTLSLTRDRLLYEARWRFLVPGNDEVASGSALFTPPRNESGVVHLLPLSSTFVRQHKMPRQYFQKLERYGIWIVGDRSTHSKLIAEWRQRYEAAAGGEPRHRRAARHPQGARAW
ncbi:MAG: hypothetical protein ACT443_11645 [Gemmatimonadota bacterium]